jgi:hypothetical protein
VRKAGNRVRVTAQLIDAKSDHHVWAERYDRDLEDIFAIQDEVTSAIVATLPGRLEAAARSRTERKPPASMAAYECVLEAKTLHRRSSRDDNLIEQVELEREGTQITLNLRVRLPAARFPAREPTCDEPVISNPRATSCGRLGTGPC